MKTTLLTDGKSNTKTAKSQGIQRSFIMHLSPYKNNSYGKNVCGHASPGCAAACLNTAGRGKFSNVSQARIRKTDGFFENKKLFLTRLVDDLRRINQYATLSTERFAVRLNGTSDLDFIELIKVHVGIDVLSEFKSLKFYDYTKNLHRAMKYLNSDYNLTFSRSETNHEEAMRFLRLGGNVAIVFDSVPKTYMGYRVIDGDESDLRHNDPENVIVGLKAKGDAKKDESGFVIRLS